MSQRVLLLLGTSKGGFILESDAERQCWELRGPVCVGWPIHEMRFDAASGTIYAGGGSEWYGAAVWRSPDLGETWSHSSDGLHYGEGGPSLKTVWTVRPDRGRVYAGVDPAGLFSSDDGGVTWQHVRGLRDHPSCPNWMPGGGGLCLHSAVGAGHAARAGLGGADHSGRLGRVTSPTVGRGGPACLPTDVHASPPRPTPQTSNAINSSAESSAPS